MPDNNELSMFGVSPSPELSEGEVKTACEGEVSPKKPIKKNRPVAPKPEEGPEVWFPCRAKEDCPGRQSRLLLRVKNPGGGSVLRYRCLTCKRVFSITT